VLEWLARLPAAEVDRRPRLLLAAAWTLALSERHDEASRLVDRILAQPSGLTGFQLKTVLYAQATNATSQLQVSDGGWNTGVAARLPILESRAELIVAGSRTPCSPGSCARGLSHAAG
jgi:LuxR family maltose regulon positive regulatory protein